MEKQKLYIVYFKSTAEMDAELLSLFEKQAEVIVASDLTMTKNVVEDHEGQIAMLAVDLREEPEYGNEKLNNVQIQPILKELPLVTICKCREYKEYTVSMEHGAEIVDLPVHKENFIRRCNRACKRLNFSLGENKTV